MIRLFLISALLGGLAFRGHAQPLTEWIGQLAALQTLQQTVEQGYATVAGGLQTIGDLRYGEYRLHAGWFGSLDTVKPVIDEDPRVQALRSRLATMITQLRTALDYWQRQSILSP
ncbi:MAG TPA: hypothetical protein VKQ52_04175 [Puia sp.]|nr:hypothetical protein [Puia sp.]